jgi:hypothetical protein
MINWYVEGIKFGNCNCDYARPCQFESRPTHGKCHGIEVIRIERGFYRGDAPQGTLHSRIRADGEDRLPASHPAAAYRFG